MAATFTQGYLSRDEAGQDIILPAPLSLATIELASTASKNYNIGDYMIYGNKLYKVNKMIYKGSSIAGSITETTIGEELKTAGAVILQATLAAGNTSLSFTNTAITSESRITPYSDPFGIAPESAVVSGNTCTLTFPEQESAVRIQLEIAN